jgi:hypothetical protein
MLISRLEELKKDGWYSKPYMDPEAGRLARLLLLSPCQQKLAQHYGVVVNVDVCEGRNRYKFPLATFVDVDGENKSRRLTEHCVLCARSSK